MQFPAKENDTVTCDFNDMPQFYVYHGQRGLAAFSSAAK